MADQHHRGENTPGDFGVHGGQLLPIDEGFVELSVFETNVPPRFRLYFLDRNRRAMPPVSGPVEIETVRPMGDRQRFAFRNAPEYLESTSMIPEPHEFELMLTISTGGRRREYTARFTESAHSHGSHGHDHDHGNGHADHGKGHGHGHGHGGAHGHVHGIVDPAITTTTRGLWAVKWSFIALFVTASLQLIVVVLSHSIALLADTIHNFGDAATAVPLSVAFLLARRPPSRRFNFGLGRVEDLAGLAVVLTITGSAIVAGYVAIDRILHPRVVSHLGAIIVASIIGFVGNEGVAIFRIRIGKQIGSAALIADGYHARTDGWTSLAVLGGAIGVYFGYPIADPVIGLLITLAILGIVWSSVKMVVVRMLDGIEPEVVEDIRERARSVKGVVDVSDVRARWLGHRLRAEVNVAVDPALSVQHGHDIAKEVEHELRHLPFLSAVMVHVDPATESGEARHFKGAHEHDELAAHAH